jgi:hypothetical protein
MQEGLEFVLPWEACEGGSLTVNSPKLQELLDEFREVVAGRRAWGDAVAPPFVFLLIHLCCGVWPAIWGAVGLAVSITAIRLIGRRPLRYALGGLGGVAVASLAAVVLDRGEGFFLPGMASGSVTSAVCLVSVIVRRPVVAWTSSVARRWPLAWYWHPQVRPAYSEVTLAWFVFFAGRLLLQYFFFQRGATDTLAVVNLVLGWPALILLLAASYLYGLWRLRTLRGPSVEEFKRKAPPPWTGQKKGF